jgi:hypothetical protein
MIFTQSDCGIANPLFDFGNWDGFDVTVGPKNYDCLILICSGRTEGLAGDDLFVRNVLDGQTSAEIHEFRRILELGAVSSGGRTLSVMGVKPRPHCSSFQVVWQPTVVVYCICADRNIDVMKTVSTHFIIVDATIRSNTVEDFVEYKNHQERCDRDPPKRCHG